ncbi:MAG TPA: HD domain-containing protein [Rhizomicrobium sp.]|nr:HD domain-containing protein [Rhizomicrobium sp.]
MPEKKERIRDPVHDLIEFGSDEFEYQCWRVAQTDAFQRLRRIKQLGFSELVYPGATHTRLAHSYGVFHTARQLTHVVKGLVGEAKFDRVQANAAIAAALVHDVGHGPFSHAFEHTLELVGIEGSHEDWTVRIIKETDVRAELEVVRPGFADMVARIIGSDSPADVYCSIVSSQFDADRLDYMRRDRMMTGTQQGAIDFRWLLANLRIGRVDVGQDGEYLKQAETFVIAPKSVMAAESYVLGLFHLYPTVYMHKTTRGAECIFSALFAAVFQRILDGDIASTGLPKEHPIVTFARAPERLEAYLALDDAVITGALPLLKLARVPIISKLATRLLSRRLYKCVDVGHEVAVWARRKFEDREHRRNEASKAEARIRQLIAERGLLQPNEDSPVLLEDVAERNPYKRVVRDDGALNRIWAVGEDGGMHDLGELSPVVRSLVPFHAYRLYYGDDSGKEIIAGLLREVFQ